MKYRWTTIIYLLFFFSCYLAQGNIIDNPGCEKGKNNISAGWKYRIGLGYARFIWDNTRFHSGKRSLKISLKEKGQADWRILSYLPIDSGKKYTLSAYIYADNIKTGSHAIEVQWFKEENSKKKYIRTYSASAKLAKRWNKVELANVAPPEEATHAIILLRTYEKGNYSFDDISFAEVDSMKLLKVSRQLTKLSLVSKTKAWQLKSGADVYLKEGKKIFRLKKSSAANPEISLGNIILKPNTSYTFNFTVNSKKFGSHFRFGVRYYKNGMIISANKKFINEQSAPFCATKYLNFHTPDTIEFDNLSFYITLDDFDTLYISNMGLKENKIEPNAKKDVVWKVTKPCYRNTIYPSQTISTIKAVAMLGASYKASSYTVSFYDDKGNELYQKKYSNDKKQISVSIPLKKDMKPGKYHLRIKGNNPTKEMQMYSTTIQLLPDTSWEVRIDKEGFIVINGKRIFMLGTKQWLPPAYMNDLGVNTLCYSDYTPLHDKDKFLTDIKRYRKFGINSFDNNCYYCSISNRTTKEQIQKKLKKALQGTINTPGFMGFMADEPLWIGIPVEEMNAFYECLKKMAPNLLGFINHAPRGTVKDLKEYLPCDIAGIDIYPIPVGNGHSVMKNKEISCVGDYMKKQKTYIDGKNISPVMFLQGFAIRGKYPTYDELRFMSYQAIVHGARGINFWVEDNLNLYSIPDFFDIAHKLLNELRDLGGVLTLSDSKTEVTVGNTDITYLGKKSHDKQFLICVNESANTIKNIAIDNPAFKKQKQLYILSEDRQVSCNGGKFTDNFKPYDVHIYSTTKNIPPSPTPRLPGAKDQRVLNNKLKEYIKQGLVDPNWKSAAWISPSKKDKFSGYVRREFTLEKKPVRALLATTAVTHYKLYVNGVFVDWDRWYYKSLVYDITKLLRKGKNVIAYSVEKVYDNSLPGGVLAKIAMKFPNGSKQYIVSDEKWLGMEGKGSDSWRKINFDDFYWENCRKTADYDKKGIKKFRFSYLYDYEADRDK